jgi:hypothetical protein
MDASVENTILQMLRDQGTAITEQGKAIARIDENLHVNTTRLFGNGQPGIIQHLVARGDEATKRLDRMDVIQARYLGYASAAGTFGGIALTWVGKKFGIHL